MKESGKDAFILKKSYEIAYALFRLAAKISEKGFAENISRQGTELLGSVALGKRAEAQRSITAIEYFAKLGVDLNFISLQNGDLLFGELAGLRAALQDSGNPANQVDAAIDIADIFSKDQRIEATEEVESIFEPKFEPKKEKEIRKEPVISPGIDLIPINAETRQERILEKIRQTGNCRIKDLQEVLPECSERTIRYDLQALIEEGIVERRGNGGPAVYYRLRPVETV